MAPVPPDRMVDQARTEVESSILVDSGRVTPDGCGRLPKVVWEPRQHGCFRRWMWDSLEPSSLSELRRRQQVGHVVYRSHRHTQLLPGSEDLILGPNGAPVRQQLDEPIAIVGPSLLVREAGIVHQLDAIDEHEEGGVPPVREEPHPPVLAWYAVRPRPTHDHALVGPRAGRPGMSGQHRLNRRDIDVLTLARLPCPPQSRQCTDCRLRSAWSIG